MIASSSRRSNCRSQPSSASGRKPKPAGQQELKQMKARSAQDAPAPPAASALLPRSPSRAALMFG